MLRKKVFVTDHGWKGLSLPRLIPYGKFVDGFLLISIFSARKFSKYSAKIRVIYGGVDPEVFKPVKSARYRKVIFLGRIMPHKGVNYLIEAMYGVDDAKLVILGHRVDTRFYHYLVSLSRSLNANVNFMLDASDEAIVRELSTATVLVLPSVYRDIYGKYYPQPELLGLALLEAMACETPVICTNVGGMPEIVINGLDGFVVPPNDPRALREKILFLLDNPDIAVEMGKRGREKVLQYFTWDKVAERCLSAYVD
jgi:glycosyltransferase involved in cell wall biosynthesis